ncbi:MAG: IS1182 family transposase [Candidatus Dormiibacterota bacterium]
MGDRVEPSEAAPLVAAGSNKTFRPYNQAQGFLLPPSLEDWLPQSHVARFISEAVDEMLDLSQLYASYQEADGAPPYDPRMLLKVLLYGYSVGVTSSRALERSCVNEVACRYLAANQLPDYRSIARFRRRHLQALESLFSQVLAGCAMAGLVRLGRVALDGTKLRASASRHKAMSYDHMDQRLQALQAQVRALLAEAEAKDQAEDRRYGKHHRGDEIPEELQRRESRIAKLKEAKAALEAQAREQAAAVAAERCAQQGKGAEETEAAVEKASAKAVPPPRAQRNFTDPESRMMKTGDGSFQYGYNAQTVGDDQRQVILATKVTQCAGDVGQLLPMIEQTRAALAAAGMVMMPRQLLADAGYCSQENLTALDGQEVDILIATGRLKHDEAVAAAPRGRIPKDATLTQRMARRLRTKSGRAAYARRKAIVEPVFGQMKVRQQAGVLRLRGLEGAQGEWTLHALCHNLRKLANSGVRPGQLAWA